MPAEIGKHEVHPDLPIDQAWQQGRRLYARCGSHTQLRRELDDLGAQWDSKEGALWVGSGKRDRFTSLVLEHHARMRRLSAEAQDRRTECPRLPAD